MSGNMNSEKIGKFICDLRKKYNLTQKELADKLNVTAQAVSKWENGRGVPDIELLKKLSEEFDISITELIEGEEKNNGKKIATFVAITLVVLSICTTIFGLYVSKDQDSFNFSSLTCSNDSFDIEGVIAYNNSKKSIYISDINYCGEAEEPKFIAVECILYEKHENNESRIAKYGNLNKKNTESYNLSYYLKDIRFNINNFTFNDYPCTCDNVCENIYIKINGLTKDDNIITYDIPLEIMPDCK